MNVYYDIYGNEKKVSISMTGPPMRKGGPATPEVSLSRSLSNDRINWSLYESIFHADTGILNDKAAQNIPLAAKTRWLHLWDGYTCETITALEVRDSIILGYVPEHLTIRASHYMHLI